MKTRTILLSLLAICLYAVDYQDYDVGAKWNVEYRIMSSVESKEFFFKFINRNDYGVRVSVTAAPGIGSGDKVSRSIIIGKEASVIIGPMKEDYSKYAVSLVEIKKGVVAQKRIRYYDMNGELVDTNQQVFIGEDETDLNILSGLDIGYALDALGYEYNRDVMLKKIQTGKVYGYGLLSGDLVRDNYQYLEVPSKEQRNGLPIWVIQFELESGSRIVSAFKRYKIY